jgi:hypothetical protein
MNMFVKKYLDIKASGGSKVYTIGVNHHEAFGEYPRLINVSPPHCKKEITNEVLQAELLSHPPVYKFPRVDVAVLGTHEDYFCYHFGRLFSEKIPSIAYPKILQDKFGYVFQKGYYEEMYDDGEYVIMKRIK